MNITRTEIWKFSIPMHPFTIATGTMDFAQNIFIRVHTDAGFYGVGECSAFPMITGETQGTCFAVAKDFAAILKNQDALQREERMHQLHDHIAFNATIKSAFDIALHDIAAKAANVPLYKFLGGKKKLLETDLTIGIDSPGNMATTATEYKNKGVGIIKIKVGKNAKEDIERVRLIREAVGNATRLRIDANQGWNYQDAEYALCKLADYNIEFCEQPMRYWDDDKLPELKTISPVKIMADESVFSHYDAERLIKAGACDYVNIKFAKSGGILEATKINTVCARHNIKCMMGGMLESRIASTAFAHFAMIHDNIVFYDMDTSLIGHKVDPVTDGVQYNGFMLEVPDLPGLGADVDNKFLNTLEKIVV